MPRRANILWIMTDEQRCDSLGCYGSPWARTPALDALAAQGVVFANAVTPSPMCVPARTSILCSLPPSATGVWQNEDNPRWNPAARCTLGSFEQAGYRTASFGKQHYQLSRQAFAHEEQITTSPLVDCTRYREPYDPRDWGAIQYPGPTPWILGGRFPGTEEQTSEAEVLRRALGWLDGQDRSSPFLLRLSFNGPHTPVVPPAPYDALIPEQSVVFPEGAERPASGLPRWLEGLRERYASSRVLTPAQVMAMRRYYYGYVAYLDSLCGRFLGELARRGLAERTIVVFSSDHGTHLGDHELVQKQTFYEEVVRVPLIVRFPPTVRAGVRIETPVELLHLLELLLALSGASSPRDPRAAELLEALRGGAEPPRRPVWSEMTLNPAIIRTHERLVMVREGKWKLSVNLDDLREDGALYNLSEDPQELRNLYGERETAGVTAGLRARIRARYAEGELGREA